MSDQTEVTLSIMFTKKEWSEIAYACESQALGIERGDYPGCGSQEELDAWADALRSVYQKITDVLDLDEDDLDYPLDEEYSALCAFLDWTNNRRAEEGGER